MISTFLAYATVSYCITTVVGSCILIGWDAMRGPKRFVYRGASEM